MSEIDPDELRALARRIIESGVLGRSRTHAAILEYLVECSLSGETPKEAAIAVDVLGREADFDVGRDSVVRVQLYHLRNRLDAYYREQGRDETWRLHIPKGQYSLVAEPRGQPAVETAPEAEAVPAGGGEAAQPGLRASPVILIGLLIAALLLANLVYLSGAWPAPSATLTQEAHPARALAPWNQVLDDDAPILLVIGDYYIFGEVGEGGNIRRLVREFDINSHDDLELRAMLDPDNAGRFYDLGLSYIPNGVASALIAVMPLLHDQGRRLSVKMVSALTAADLARQHVIYLGYISGLRLLEGRVFAASGLRVGETYDELETREGDARFLTDSAVLTPGSGYRDYGLISNFPTSRGQRVIVLAGMRDAGLVNVAQQISNADSLQALLEALPGDDGEPPEAWEALYEVYGLDRTNFDADLVFDGVLAAERIWRDL